MAKAKKVLSFVMAVLMMTLTFATAVPTTKASAAETLPTVKFVGLQNIPAAVGEEQTLFLTSNYTGDVQYQVFYLQRNDPTKKATEGWTKLGDWTVAANAQVPAEVKVPAGTITVADNYSFAVRVKRAGVTGAYSNSYGDYDGAYAFNYRFAATATEGLKAAKVESAEVAVGDKFVVSGLVAGNSYRLFTLNEARAARWDAAPVATSTTDKLEWAPTAAGNYVLDVQLMGADGKVAAVKLFNVKVVDALKVTKVVAPSKNKVVVTFNQKVGTVAPANFVVTEKDDEYAWASIDSVSVKDNVVTLTTDDLSDDTAYVLEAKDVKSADGKLTLASSKSEFTYKEVTAAASIAFTDKTVEGGTEADPTSLKDSIVIKDKDGNDITDNLIDDVTFESSDESVIDADGDIVYATTDESAFVVVNATLTDGDDNDLETGNTIIEVYNSLERLGSIGAVSLETAQDPENADFDDPKTSLNEEEDGVYYLNAQLLNTDGDDYGDADNVTITYKQSNYSAFVVEKDGKVRTTDSGSATVYITAEHDATDVKVTKAVTLTVKADPEPTKVSLNKTSFKLVSGDNVNYEDTKATVEAKVLDQYGNAMSVADLADANFKVKISKDNFVAEYSKTETEIPYSVAVDDDDEAVLTLYLSPAEVDTAAGSATLTVKYDDFYATASVSVVEAGADYSYVAEADDTKLDVYNKDTENRDSDDDNYAGPGSTGITVYRTDKAGNKLYIVDSNVTLDTEDKDYVTTDGSLTVTANDAGTEKVTVYVEGAKIATITFTVVDTTPVISKVELNKTVVTVDELSDDLGELVFGKWITNDDGDRVLDTKGAIVTYDQFGSKIEPTYTGEDSDIDVISTNTDVVLYDADGTFTVGEDGTADLIILANDKLVTVKVKVALED